MPTRFQLNLAHHSASGVEHYWIVDPPRDRVVAYRLDPATSAYEVVLDQVGGLVELSAPIPVAFALSDLMAQ